MDRRVAVRVAAAVLFYNRSWDENPDDAELSIPSMELTLDGGRRASQLLDEHPFPAEIMLAAEVSWESPT